MSNIKYKFEINDTVYYIETTPNPHKEICEMCLSEGFLLRKDNSSIICPKCEGKKMFFNSGSIKQIIKEDNVRNITIKINEKNIIAKYYLRNNNKKFYEDELFLTENEAENNKLK